MNYFQTIYLVLIVGILIFGFHNAPTQNCDIWWHLQNGKLIVEDNIWPSPDQYSYITNNTSWVVHSWLADCIFFFLFKYFGYSILGILSIFTHLCFSALCAFFYYKNNVRLEICAMVAILAMYLVSEREIRPFIFSEIGVTTFFLFLYRTKPNNLYLLIFPLLSTLWINIHPFSLVFSFFLTNLVIGFSFVFFINKFSTNIINIDYDKRWFIISTLFVLFSFIHPEIFACIQRTLYAQNYGTLDWSNLYYVTYQYPKVYYLRFIIIHLIIMIFIYRIKYLRNIKCASGISTTLFCILSIILSIVFERTQWMIIFPLIFILDSTNRMTLKRNDTYKINYYTPLIFYIILQLSRLQLPSVEEMPVQALQYWNENDLSGNVFCKWTWSGYVYWSSNGTAKIFVDTRIEPFEQRDIEIANLAPHHLSQFLDELVRKDTQYLLLDINSNSKQIEELLLNKLVIPIHRNDKELLLKINKIRVIKLHG